MGNVQFNLPALSEAKALNNLAAHCFTMASVDVRRDSTASWNHSTLNVIENFISYFTAL